jgi:drug/metabolite transporter (DMT)-like permease
VLSLLFAFAAAFLGAMTVVTQHVASTAAPATVKGWRLARYLVRNPLWLFGVASTVGSFVLQALALYNGRLSMVQSILVTELVFSLVIGRVWLRRHVRAAAWVSASVTSAGLAIFLVMSEPKGGHPQATTQAWLPALLTFGGIALVCTVLAGRGTAVRRGALYAAASGIVSATLATFLKSSTDTLAASGIPVLLTRGPIYGVLASVVVSTILTQAALRYGPLAVSQPLMVIVNPFASVALGIWLYGEHFTGGAPQLGVAAIGFTAMVVGVISLARTAPSFEATPATTPAPRLG